MGVDLYGGPQIMVLVYGGAQMTTYGVTVWWSSYDDVWCE